MSAVFDAYAAYYDALYRDKDYPGEAAYVGRLLERHAPGARDLLELGCGTGGHARHLAAMGYRVHGIDLSERMLRIARDATATAPVAADAPTFDLGDIRSWRSPRRFDAVLSLFHVLSYQTADEDARATFLTAAAQLREGGVLVADYWNGPAVRAIGPEPRTRTLAVAGARVTRRARPVHDADARVVEVHYDIEVEDLENGTATRLREVHPMRYFFREELEGWLASAGMVLVACHAWLGDPLPGDDDWSAVLVARRTG